jgi:hypothetical protein
MTRVQLIHVLGRQYEELLIRQAETIRDWPPGRERTEYAEIHVRTALLDQICRQVSQATLNRIYSILSFVMPDDGTFDGEPMPLAELERESEWEAAYHEQIKRRSCPECGDGTCPTDEPGRL